MKKLVIIALALVTLNGFAQKKEHRKMDRNNTSELRIVHIGGIFQ